MAKNAHNKDSEDQSPNSTQNTCSSLNGNNNRLVGLPDNLAKAHESMANSSVNELRKMFRRLPVT